ncbi:MAG: hypothetical protein P4N41_18630, partial [Negativicutes bacterium]|nr:hypothetical protein [Negativicutes bacterium]
IFVSAELFPTFKLHYRTVRNLLLPVIIHFRSLLSCLSPDRAAAEMEPVALDTFRQMAGHACNLIPS